MGVQVEKKLITCGNDHAFKMAVLRTLDWEPVIHREFKFKRSCGWRDGVVSGITDVTQDGRRVDIVVVRFWTSNDKFVRGAYTFEKWFRLCAEGHIVQRKPFWLGG